MGILIITHQDECEQLGMGGYLGVQQGSRFPPRFVHLTYRPENPSADTVKIALVGKGLTFDRYHFVIELYDVFSRLNGPACCSFLTGNHDFIAFYAW